MQGKAKGKRWKVYDKNFRKVKISNTRKQMNRAGVPVAEYTYMGSGYYIGWATNHGVMTKKICFLFFFFFHLAISEP
jgi:hypothetical protein